MSLMSSDPETNQAHETGHWDQMNSTKQGEAKHFSTGKVQLHQIPRWVLWQIAKVCVYGAFKYGKWNWKAGMPFSEIFDSAQRHMDDWWEGTNLDYESQLHHLDHALCDLIFLRWYTRFRMEFDDRPIKPLQDNLYEMEGTISPELRHHWEELRRQHAREKQIQSEGQGQS